MNNDRIFWVTPLAAALLLAAWTAAADIAIPKTIDVPQGAFIMGSDRAERQAAYALDEAAYGHARTREWKWYENELDRHRVSIDSFSITATLITNHQYRAFIRTTKHGPPGVDPKTWKGYGLIHPYRRAQRYIWSGDDPPADRLDHPVVLVSHADARAYAAWLSKHTGRVWRLPSEIEWEKAARGNDGRLFPWGNEFNARLLNSHDKGPFDTVPVGRFTAGNSPHGLVDAAGQVFEWTATPNGVNSYIVKGGSWDDSGCGICRPAARHGRPADIKHILIGFRLVREN